MNAPLGRVRQRSEDARPSAALWGFIAAAVVSSVISFQAGRRGWFSFDDWDYLVQRTAWDLSGLQVPHIDHWSIVPILTYRALWHVFGLNHWAYLMTAIVLRVVTAALLRAVMRRAGASEWVATSAAALYLLLAASYESTAKLFALGFSGWPLVLGLTHLLLADHDGPFGPRDMLGLLAGAGAIASSALGVPMVAAVAVATLMRRGPAIAALHSLPLGAVYAAWYLRFGQDAPGTSLTGFRRFVTSAVHGVFLELGPSTVLALVLALVGIVGAVLAWRQTAPDDRRTRFALPVGLVFAGLVFLSITAYGRGDAGVTDVFGDIARLPHHMEPLAAMLLPGLAVGATALSRVLPAGWLAMSLLFVVGMPQQVVEHFESTERLDGAETKQLMLSLPRIDAARRAPPDLVPEPVLTAPVTIGWLRDALEAGRLPAPPRPSTELELQAMQVRLTLSQTNGMVDTTGCSQPATPAQTSLATGEQVSLGADGYALISIRLPEGWSPAIKYGQPFVGRNEPRLGQTVTAVAGPVDVLIEPEQGSELWFCG